MKASKLEDDYDFDDDAGVTESVRGTNTAAATAANTLRTTTMTPSTRSRLVTQLIGLMCLVIVNLTFGGYSVFTSAVLKKTSLNAVVFAFLRDVLGTSLLLIGAYTVEKRKGPDKMKFWPHKEDVGTFIFVGLLGVWGSQGLSALAISNLTATFFAMCEPAMPIVTLIVSWLVGYEYFNVRSAYSWGKVAGVVVAVGGAVAMSALSSSGSSDVFTDSKNFPLGLFFTVLQVTMGGSYAVAQKPLLLKRYSPIVVAAWGYAYGTGLLLLSVITSADSTADWDLPPIALAGIAYAGVLSSAMNYFLMAYVNNSVGPMFVSSFMPLQSVTAAALSWAFLNEPVVLATTVGGVGVIAGLFILVLSRYAEGSLPAAAAFADAADTAAADAVASAAASPSSSSSSFGSSKKPQAARTGHGNRRKRTPNESSSSAASSSDESQGTGSDLENGTAAAAADGNTMRNSANRGGRSVSRATGSSESNHADARHQFGARSAVGAAAAVAAAKGKPAHGSAAAALEINAEAGATASSAGGDDSDAYRTLRGVSAEQNEFIKLLGPAGGTDTAHAGRR